MGKINSTNARWESTDQRCRVVVEYVNKATHDGRLLYRWYVLRLNDPNESIGKSKKTYKRVATEADLRSGVGDEVDAMDMLETFAGFVEAWIEACSYGDEDSENRDLFPQSMYDIMYDYHDELYLDVNEADMMRDHIQELERKVKSGEGE